MMQITGPIKQNNLFFEHRQIANITDSRLSFVDAIVHSKCTSIFSLLGNITETQGNNLELQSHWYLKGYHYEWTPLDDF